LEFTKASKYLSSTYPNEVEKVYRKKR